jgi:hypothetical protein
MKNLFGSSPVRPPLDAVTRMRQLTGAGLSEDEARAVVGREIDGGVDPAAAPKPRLRRVKPLGSQTEPVAPSNVILAPAVRSAREAPASPDITNRFRPAAAQEPAKRFDPVLHYSLAEPAVIGRTGRGDVIIGYTIWPESDERARYNGSLHIAGLGQSTLNLSFDALAGLVAAAPKIEAYLAAHGQAIAAGEATAAALRKAAKKSS